jgi:ABC-type glycerol-3-phosphate transport system permease component
MNQHRWTPVKIGQVVFIWLALVAVVSPYLWVMLSSFKTPADLNIPTRILFRPVLDNWNHVLSGTVPGNFVTSLIVGLITVFLSLLVGLPAAYSISHYRTGGRLTRFGILIAEVIPPAVMVVPLFLTAYHMRMNGTIAPVIVAHLTFVLPVVTWFLISFFDALPKDIESQALIDGCSRFQAFHKVVVPQVLPGIGAAGIFGFVLSWNDLFYALILGGENTKTLPMAIAGYNTFRGVQLGDMSVAILVSVLPPLFLSFFVQKKMIRGLGGGGVKG